MTIDLNGTWIHSQLADLVGVTRQTIQIAVAEGRIPSGLTLGETLRAYCARLREQAAGRMGSEVGPLDLAQERAALARAQRHLAETKLEINRGTYAAVTVMASVLASASQAVVERFDQLPGQLKKACPDLPDAARAQVMELLANARNEWVRSTEQLVVQEVIQAEDGPEDQDADDEHAQET